MSVSKRHLRVDDSDIKRGSTVVSCGWYAGDAIAVGDLKENRAVTDELRRASTDDTIIYDDVYNMVVGVSSTVDLERFS